MIFSQSPVIVIACILGMAFLAILICAGFYMTRHRLYLAKPGDTEQGAEYAGTTSRYAPDGQQHPPVYCVDDLVCPPPSYEAVFRRHRAPSHHEMRILRRRLEKLQRRRSSVNDSAADTTDTGVTGAAETAIRDSEIRCLTQWIERLEILRDQEGEQDAGPVFDSRRTMRLVHSESEPATLPMRSTTVRGATAAPAMTTMQRSATEPGLIQFARSRMVAPPPTPTGTPSSPTPDLDVRFTELREQIMRGMRNRY